jgi:hypothetical protein
MQTPDGVGAGRNSNCGFSPTSSGRDGQKNGCQESCSDSAKNNLARSATPAGWAKTGNRFGYWILILAASFESATTGPILLRFVVTPGFNLVLQCFLCLRKRPRQRGHTAEIKLVKQFEPGLVLRRKRANTPRWL